MQASALHLVTRAPCPALGRRFESSQLPIHEIANHGPCNAVSIIACFARRSVVRPSADSLLSGGADAICDSAVLSWLRLPCSWTNSARTASKWLGRETTMTILRSSFPKVESIFSETPRRCQRDYRAVSGRSRRAALAPGISTPCPPAARSWRKGIAGRHCGQRVLEQTLSHSPRMKLLKSRSCCLRCFRQALAQQCMPTAEPPDGLCQFSNILMCAQDCNVTSTLFFGATSRCPAWKRASPASATSMQ